ncbi:MAG: hypothetical protein IIC70_01180 [Acidobacteria bacterium]|nr:hypothetical protein [Acidobacteriota bacterium]
MLRACSRVLKPGALLSFFVVAAADGVSARDIAAGPEYVDAEPGYPLLMTAAGFDNVDLAEVTDEYAATLSTSIRARDAESAELEDLLGADEFAEGQSSRRQELAAVRDGLLVRYLISAVRP